MHSRSRPSFAGGVFRYDGSAPSAMAGCLSANSYLMLAGRIIGEALDPFSLSIRRSSLRLRAGAMRRTLAATRNPPLSVRVEEVVTSTTRVKRWGFSRSSHKIQIKLRLIKD